jgi:hypothetical protein
MPKTSSRGGRNNNPSGQNQYSDWNVMNMVRGRPIAAAATVAGAAAAGLFLWSKRGQISDQLTNLSNQIGQWSENMRSGEGDDLDMTDLTSSASRSAISSRRPATIRTRQGQAAPTDEVPAT